MGAKLDAAKSMSFSVKTTFEEPARNGQPLFYMVQASVSVERPDKMKIVTSGDGPPSEFLYDGKTIMEYLPTQNMVAETGAPPELGAMLDDVYDKYGFYFPFIHYLVDQSHEKLIDGLTWLCHRPVQARRRHDDRYGGARKRPCPGSDLDWVRR